MGVRWNASMGGGGPSVQLSCGGIALFETLSPSWQLVDAKQIGRGSLQSLQRYSLVEVADDDGETMLLRLTPEGVIFRDRQYMALASRAYARDKRQKRGLLQTR